MKQTKSAGWFFMKAFVLTVCLSACASPGSVATPIAGAAHEDRSDQATHQCDLVPPTPDYISARFLHVRFTLPPGYTVMLPQPGELTNTAIWTSPDSSVFFIGTDAAFGFDDSSAVTAEGTCAVSVLTNEVRMDLQRVSSALRPDTAFAGFTAFPIDSMVTLSVGFVTRTRAERQRLIGVLSRMAVPPQSAK